ncbi:unnamed protein product [Callosobruchus maculatus]|nr:unnamed protein product [Callosobruchus maculatus]
MIKYKSFKIIQENIAIAEELGYDNEKILKNGYVLNNYPKYARTILEDFSNIAGLDMKNAVKVHPKLLMISPNNIIRIYGILKEFGVHDEAIRKYPQIFTMSPETIKTRLQIIDGNNNVKFLLKHPQLLKLILYHKRTKKRLSFIQELQLKCASITVLGTTGDAAFEKYIREGKDINHPGDVVFFVNNLFKTQDPSLKNRLMKHPYYLQVPLYKMAETYNFLVHRKFHPTNIYKVVHIILYPRNKIKNIIDSMTKEDIHDVDYKSLSQTEKLNILIYLMEKEHHFTGNGVWSNETTDTEAPLEIPEETYLPDSAEQPKM